MPVANTAVEITRVGYIHLLAQTEELEVQLVDKVTYRIGAAHIRLLNGSTEKET